MDDIKKDSLVIYKGQPAKVLGLGKKIDIKLQSGESKSVRDKDFLYLHPGPVSSLNIPELEANIEEVWALLLEEEVTLYELAELLYQDDSVISTYNAYQQLQKDLFFTGEIDNIKCHTEEHINSVLKKEEEKDNKEREFEESIERLADGRWSDQDENALRDIEFLALEQKGNSKILNRLGIKETSLEAHKFLVKIGYWKIEHNPYPARLGVSLKSTIKQEDYITSINPTDLTHLESYAIDDEGSTDPDDAISIDGNKLWIHITDVASIIKPGSKGDLDASSKGSNLYLPTETVHMLPKEATEIQALGNTNGNNTISFMVEFDPEFNIVDRNIFLSRVNVTRLSYAEVEERKDSPEFKPFYDIAHILMSRREAKGALTISLPEVRIRVDQSGEIDIKPINGIVSRNVVSEFMLLAGETAAIFCHKNSIPIPYATQLPPEAKGTPNQDLASMFVWRRKFKRGETKFHPEPHSGLGLDYYTRATSPLRRYSDLVVNQQIRSFLLKEKLLKEEEILIKVSPAIESSKKLSICERASNLHWKLVYLSRNKEKVYSATYVEKKDKNSGTFLIEDLALEVNVNMAEFPELNSKVDLKLKKVDIFNSLVTFIPY